MPSTTDWNSPVAVAAADPTHRLTPRSNTSSILPRRSLRSGPSRRDGSVRISISSARLIVVSSFACLSLIGACVDTSQPARLAQCARDHSCSGQAGSSGGGGTTGTEATGGQGGTAGSGGATAGSGGGTEGRGGGTAGGGGAGSGGAGSGGGGSSGPRDAGSSSDTVVDAPYLGPETESPSDTNPPEPDAQEDVVADAPLPGAETGKPESRPEPGPDALPDLALDRAPDLTPDTLPPRPEAGLDAGNCIQRFQANGYSLGTDASTAACSGCMENLVSKETQCRAMIDCMAPLWPSCAPASSCWTTCHNNTNSDSVVQDFVANLTRAACGASH